MPSWRCSGTGKSFLFRLSPNVGQQSVENGTTAENGGALRSTAFHPDRNSNAYLYLEKMMKPSESFWQRERAYKGSAHGKIPFFTGTVKHYADDVRLFDN